MKKSKTKKLKLICTLSLCAVISTASALAFILPSVVSSNQGALGATPQTENVGLITPRATDPTILTTESGLEIKYGNVSISPSLGSGSLAGYPYFTTNDGSKDYTWVIIGMNDGLEKESPAGSAIKNDTNQNLRALYGWSKSIKINNEIPVGKFLVLSNASVATGGYGFSGVYASSDIGNAMNGYYTNGSFGLSSIKTQIIQSQIKTRDWTGSGNSTVIKTSNAYIFPLHANNEGSFYYLDYVSASVLLPTLTSLGWLRGTSHFSSSKDYCYNWYISTGGILYTQYYYASGDYRPAFVMSL